MRYVYIVETDCAGTFSETWRVVSDRELAEDEMADALAGDEPGVEAEHLADTCGEADERHIHSITREPDEGPSIAVPITHAYQAGDQPWCMVCGYTKQWHKDTDASHD